MSHTILYRHAKVLWQKEDEELALPEPAVAASLDANDLICLEQQEDTIILNLASLEDFCSMVRELRREAKDDHKRKSK